MTDTQYRNISIWLLLVCAVIFAMIVLGGVTRLTGSGLSMVEWAPITGILPPLNTQQWMAVFELYQASPEYLRVNSEMDLQGFKSIYWFEYLHRILGRLIGVLFFLPMLYFFIRYPLSRLLKLKLFGLFLLGGAQGLLGWYMVQSGLVNDPHVSQYRLVAHLSLALALYGAIFWMASAYFVRDGQSVIAPKRNFRLLSIAAMITIFITLLAGGFVAGTKAGFAFNTFPLMNGRLIPEGYATLKPFWLNWFENIAAVQFNHRLLATASLILAFIVYIKARRSQWGSLQLRRVAALLLLGLVTQFILGVLTLINVVPVTLGALHQATAVIVFTISILLVRTTSQLKIG